MKRTYLSPSVEIVVSNLRQALLQESDEETMYIDPDTVVPGPIDENNKLVNGNSLWDEE